MSRFVSPLQRQHVVRFTLISISTILMVVVLRQVDWTAVPGLLERLEWGLVAVAVVLLLFSQLIVIVRWQYLLQDPATGFGKLLVFAGAGLFSNTFLPSGVGGDGVRIALLSRSVALSRAVVSVGVDRVVGLVGLSALLGTGLWLGLPPGLHLSTERIVKFLIEWQLILAGAATTSVVGLAALLLLHRNGQLQHPAFHTAKRFIGARELSQWLSVRGLVLLGGAYLLTIIAHFVIVLANWAMLRALGIEVSFAATVWLVLATAISLLFPISINGLGVREATFVAILSAYSVANTPALLAALLTRLVLLLFALLGGICWMLGTRASSNEGFHEPRVPVR